MIPVRLPVRRRQKCFRQACGFDFDWDQAGHGSRIFEQIYGAALRGLLEAQCARCAKAVGSAEALILLQAPWGEVPPQLPPAFLAGITGGEAMEATALGAGTGLEDEYAPDTG